MRHYFEWGGGHNFASMFDDSNTKLLIHSDTTDESTTFTDSSDTGHSLTANGSIEHSTDYHKWGKTSINGTGGILGDNFVSLSDNAEFALSNNALTIDFWVRLANEDTHTFYYQQADEDPETDDDNYFEFTYDGSEFVAKERVRDGGGTSTPLLLTWDYVLDLNKFYHIALIRGWNNDATKWMVTVNGEPSDAQQTSSRTIVDYAGDIQVCSVDGYVDEFRVTNGIARWVSPFKTPAGPY